MPNGFALLGSGDFKESLKKLLPRGRAWPKDADEAPVQDAFWAAIADAFAAFHAAIAGISEVESDPRLTGALLADWELCYGLPDPCTPQPQSDQQRRAALLARITDPGGASISAFVARAAAIGVTITVTEFQPFRVGISSVGQALTNGPWQFAWQVNGPLAGPIVYFAVGLAAAGDPLVAWGNAQLQCVLKAIAPAHTILIFFFS